MAGNDWSNLGEEIKKTVQNAVENQDYSKLNQNITEMLNKGMDLAVDSVKRGAEQAKQNAAHQKNAYHYHPERTSRKAAVPHPVPGNATTRPDRRSAAAGGRAVSRDRRSAENQLPAFYKKTGGSKAAGLIAAIGGGTLLGAFGLIFPGLMLAGGMAGFAAEFFVVAGILAVPAAAGAWLLSYGLRLMELEKRFRGYKQCIGAREYCNVDELASIYGRTEKKTVKDLERMIGKGWFVQGHLDESRKCMITTHRMYQEYKKLGNQRRIAAEQEKQARIEAQKREDMLNARLTPEAKQVIEAGDAYVKKIRACNDAIPGVEISEKIHRMERIVDQIFDRIEQKPEQIPEIRKLMDYYLPTTVKLLEAYEELDAQPVEGENIRTSKAEIEATIDTLNTAFEKILDDLFHHTAWDVSSDISVLNTMLAQEGLKDDGLKR